jgi:hypothetical protein
MEEIFIGVLVPKEFSEYKFKPLFFSEGGKKTYNLVNIYFMTAILEKIKRERNQI